MRSKAGIVTGALLLGAGPAAAQTMDSYRVPANSTRTYDLELCGARVHVRADGDNDTDLDYILRDDRGTTIHSDFDTTDLMLYTVENGSGGCRTYTLEVRNLGRVYNQMQLTMTTLDGNPTPVRRGDGNPTPVRGPAGRDNPVPVRGPGSSSSGSDQSYRIDANASRTIDLNLCARTVRMEARGDEDTDLDFTVYDDRGNTVHTDNDLTDWTVATLRTGGGGCYTYRLEVRNLGNVYNQMRLTLTDQ